MLRIGIIDSGVEPSQLKYSTVVAWKDFVNNRPNPYDNIGHGTKVAQTIESTVVNLDQTNPIQLIVARVNPGSIQNALSWMASQNLDALNLSIASTLNIPIDQETLLFFEQVYDSGCLTITAGGNGIENLGLVPGFAPTTGYNNPFAITVGWPVVGSSHYVDVMEDSDDGSSFSAPQVTAKAALLNSTVKNPDLVWEALMVTAEQWPAESSPRLFGPFQYDPEALVPWSPDLAKFFQNTESLTKTFVEDPYLMAYSCQFLTEDLSGACYNKMTEAANYIDSVLKNVRISPHALTCALPGDCGWGFPRYFDAKKYIASRNRAEWFRAGTIPSNLDDPRWITWAPGYALRVMVTMPNLPNVSLPSLPPVPTSLPDPVAVKAETTHFIPLPENMAAVVGNAQVAIPTPVGLAWIGGPGIVRGANPYLPGINFPTYDTLPFSVVYTNATREHLMGVWSPSGLFVALYLYPPPTTNQLGQPIAIHWLGKVYQT